MISKGETNWSNWLILILFVVIGFLLTKGSNYRELIGDHEAKEKAYKEREDSLLTVIKKRNELINSIPEPEVYTRVQYVYRDINTSGWTESQKLDTLEFYTARFDSMLRVVRQLGDMDSEDG